MTWRPFTTLPAIEDSMGPSGFDIWIWQRKTGRIYRYTNWNNWSTRKEQKELIANGDMWVEVAPPKPPVA